MSRLESAKLASLSYYRYIYRFTVTRVSPAPLACPARAASAQRESRASHAQSAAILNLPGCSIRSPDRDVTRPSSCVSLASLDHRASRVSRGGSSIQIEEGRSPQRRAMVSGANKGSWARVTRETCPERHYCLVRSPLLSRVRNLLSRGSDGDG